LQPRLLPDACDSNPDTRWQTNAWLPDITGTAQSAQETAGSCGQQAKEAAQNTADSAQDKACNIGQQAKQTGQSAQDTAADYTEQAKGSAQNSAESVQDQASKFGEQGKQAGSDAKGTASDYSQEAADSTQATAQSAQGTAGRYYQQAKDAVTGTHFGAHDNTGQHVYFSLHSLICCGLQVTAFSPKRLALHQSSLDHSCTLKHVPDQECLHKHVRLPCYN